MEDDSELRSSRELALRILGSRSLSAGEVEKRLVRKGETEQNAKEAVKWLEEIGLINDAEYATMIVRHYSAKGYGLARIKDELFRRGIQRDMWDDALSVLGEADAPDAAARFLEKKLKGSGDKDDLRRAADALCRRGFSYEQARTAVANYVESLGVELSVE